MGKLLVVDHLTITYTRRQQEVVKDCSFELESQEILGIVGESGSGKSTMAMAILGFLKKGAVISSGQIRYCGEDITPPLTDVKRRKLRGGEIAVIMQNAMSCLDPLMKIGRQIMESLRLHTDCTRQEAKEKAEELLDMVGIRDVSACMNRYPFECSGGMQQRICIAIALAGNPKVLIADEPTTALDVTVQAQILNLLRRLSKDLGIAVIMISHDLGVVGALCNRLLVMREGSIVEQGRVSDILYHSSETYTKMLIQTRKNLEQIPQAASEADKKDILLHAKNVCKEFRQKKVLHSITIAIQKNQSYGLVGESGCGKSTFARILAGLYRPEQGEMYWKGREMNWKSRKQRIDYRKKIQMIFQNPYQALNPTMTVYENLQEALMASGISDEKEIAEQLRRMLDEVGLEEQRKQDYPQQLSGGQLQRVMIARALLMNPEFLICDEPFSGLDIQTQEQLVHLLCKMKEKEQLSMLFIGHDLSIVGHISDTLGVIYDGWLVEEGPSGELMEEPWHPYTKALFMAADRVRLNGSEKKRPFVIEEVTEQGGKAGCPYVGTCKYAKKRCFAEKPEIYEYQGHKVRCFLYAEEMNQVRDAGYTMRTQI